MVCQVEVTFQVCLHTGERPTYESVIPQSGDLLWCVQCQQLRYIQSVRVDGKAIIV